MKHRNLELETAVAEVESRYIAANPKSEAHFNSARAVMPGANTRTTMHYDPYPVVLVGGRDAQLIDLDGHEYVDMLGEYTAGLFGHSEPAIIDAIREALDQGLVLGGPNRYEARFAALMCQRFPAVKRVRFCNSGTEANMLCLCLARAVTSRSAILAFDGAYHGSMLAFAGGGSPINAPFETVLGTYNDIDGVRELIGRHAGSLAAVIVEPMIGSGGCIEADQAFLEMLREETASRGIILVFDEVMTSRLAPGGLHEAMGVSPDLVSFGKYLGGGVTFGAFGGRADLMDRLDPTSSNALAHSGTYNNNVLTMAAGIAALERVYTPSAVARLNESGEALRRKLQLIADDYNVPLAVKGRGSIICIHFKGGPICNPGDVAKVPAALRKLFHLDMNLRGYYIARRGFMSLSLPLTASDYNGFLSAFEEFLAENQEVIVNALAAQAAP